MKNKYLKGAHLSERKFKEILQLFSDDLTATQIASISGVSRVTINSYLKKIRQQIARYCESLQPDIYVKPSGHHRHEHAHHPDTAVTTKTEVERITKPVIFGIYQSGGRLHAEILPDVSRAMILTLTRGRSVLETLGAAEQIRLFSGVVDLGQNRLYRLHSGTQELSLTARQQSDELDAFWALTKHRLAKFKGLNRNTAYLHLKECEFRYNHRNEEMFPALLQLLKTFPLHLD
ncbi:hypothetical protein KTO58_25540 [Chitinophaga pendula]|uniref:hypothetical protein n=1 Tax=Chitinophaga TaxID=79328 RepID=UPI000BAFDFAF|nr:MULTISPECIES: hypothetical protein [Chitinophaga]ASZ10057.1 hypothetical protein CK934_03225 [Chitinophaga sp. MD30]UCJ06990.1 hypothetical protein KTO58_25540 [Chitinophaga pendula]